MTSVLGSAGSGTDEAASKNFPGTASLMSVNVTVCACAPAAASSRAAITVTDGWSPFTPLALSYAGSGATTGDGCCGYSGAGAAGVRDAGGALAYAAGGGALTCVAVGAAPGGGGVGTTLGGTTTMRSNREAFGTAMAREAAM